MICNTEQMAQDLLSEGILNEGAYLRGKLYIEELISLEYDHNRTRKIIDDYIEEYEVQGLKMYLYQLYMLSNLDSPNGIIANLKFSLSKANRMSFYQHKRKVMQMIKYGEAWIRKTEGSNYTVVKEVTGILKNIEKETTPELIEIQQIVEGSKPVPDDESFIDYILRKLEQEKVIGFAGGIIGLVIRAIRGVFSLISMAVEIAGPILAAIAAVAFIIVQIAKFVFDITGGVIGVIF